MNEMSDVDILSVPGVLRSRQHLEKQGVTFVRPGALAPAALPITAGGTTYNMAQKVTWIDASHFAVGRWDGSLSIFEFTESSTAGPKIDAAVSSPSSEGVQMITWLAPGVFATSNDEGSMIVWRSPSRTWSDLTNAETLTYDSSFGVANSGDSFTIDSGLILVVGHSLGFVTIWKGSSDASQLMFVDAVDVRAAKPVNPWNLHNVRGTAVIQCSDKGGYVVTGSEDGDLCVVSVPDGTIVSRTCYNPDAQRGINSIAVSGRDLLVANCAVGSTDKNLWYYNIDSKIWSITMLDSTMLRVDPCAPQVFNFCVIWGMCAQGLCFYSFTQEGALWMGSVDGSTLSLMGYQEVTSDLGAAIAYCCAGRLAAVAYSLYEFTAFDDPKETKEGNPQRLIDLV